MQRRNCPQGSAALSVASLRGSASAFAFVQKAAAPDWEKRGFVVQLFLGRLSPSPDWKPTAGVCFEIIYQPAIKSPGGFPTPPSLWDVFFPIYFFFFFWQLGVLAKYSNWHSSRPEKEIPRKWAESEEGTCRRNLEWFIFHFESKSTFEKQSEGSHLIDREKH